MGWCDGASVKVGASDGMSVGCVGTPLGTADGALLGSTDHVGKDDGRPVGGSVGRREGVWVG